VFDALLCYWLHSTFRHVQRSAVVDAAVNQKSETLLPVAVSNKETLNFDSPPMEASRKERREHEKAEVLSRLRIFAEHSKWKKARLSRELGVSISTVERWLDGQDNILLASMFTIRRFLETHRGHLENSNPLMALKN
jgi:hypothetical protein